MEATRKRIRQQSRTPRASAEAPVERKRVRITTVNDIEPKPVKKPAAQRKPRKKPIIVSEPVRATELEEESYDTESITSSERRRLNIPRLHREGHVSDTTDDCSEDIRQVTKTDIDFESLICDRHSNKIIYYDPVKNIIYDKNYDIVGEVDVNDGEFIFYRDDFKTGRPLDEDTANTHDTEEEEYDYERVGLSDDESQASDSDDCD